MAEQIVSPTPTCRTVNHLGAVIIDIARTSSLAGISHGYDLFGPADEICAGGQSTMYCGEPTVRCPGCNEPTDNCLDHLWEQPNGMRVCVMCAGEPEYAGVAK